MQDTASEVPDHAGYIDPGGRPFLGQRPNEENGPLHTVHTRGVHQERLRALPTARSSSLQGGHGREYGERAQIWIILWTHVDDVGQHLFLGLHRLEITTQP